MFKSTEFHTFAKLSSNVEVGWADSLSEGCKLNPSWLTIPKWGTVWVCTIVCGHSLVPSLSCCSSSSFTSLFNCIIDMENNTLHQHASLYGLCNHLEKECMRNHVMHRHESWLPVRNWQEFPPTASFYLSGIICTRRSKTTNCYLFGTNRKKKMSPHISQN